MTPSTKCCPFCRCGRCSIKHCVDTECDCHAPSDAGVNYSHVSHTHCWEQTMFMVENDGKPACGIPLEKHTQCCLCDMKVPVEKNYRESEIAKDLFQPPPTESWAERFDENNITKPGPNSDIHNAIQKIFFADSETEIGVARTEMFALVRSLLRTERESYQKELVERWEKMKKKVRDCDTEKDGNLCNSCESMMSCEIAEQSRQYNQAIDDIIRSLN